jgi:tetratricopeptide (TPR) repeat protein
VLTEAKALLASESKEAFIEKYAQLLLSESQILSALGRVDEARQSAFEVLEIRSDLLRNPAVYAVAAALLLQLLDAEDLQLGEVESRIDKLMASVTARSTGLWVTIRLKLLLQLAQVAWRRGDHDRFQQLAREIETFPEDIVLEDAWYLQLLRSRVAAEQGHAEESFQLLQHAWFDLMAYLSRSALRDLPLQFVRQREILQRETGAMAWSRLRELDSSRAMMMLAAELQGAIYQNLTLAPEPVFVERYQKRVLEENWLAEDLQFLAGTAGDHETFFLQFLLAKGLYIPLLSRVEGAEIRTRLLDPGLDAGAVASLANEVSFVLATFNPRTGRDPLAELTAWRDLSNRLGTWLADEVPAGAHLCVVPNRDLSFIPLHLCIPRGRPLLETMSVSYVPSIFGLTRLRARRRSAAKSGETLGSFVVWQAGDREAVVRSFCEHADHIAEAGRSLGWRVLTAAGREATPVRLNEFLEGCSCLHLCCHGIAGAGGLHRVLVADGRSLPPSSPTALQKSENDPFFVDWDEIRVQTAPSTVFSCCCSSGSISVLSGGERVGFERSLFQAGTGSFVAPLWDVPVEVIHGLMARLVASYLESGAQGLSSLVRRHVLEAIVAGDGRLHAAGALAIMGDWI